MLHRIGNMNPVTSPNVCQQTDNVYNRDEQTDIKKAIELLYEFKEKLTKLNPIVFEVVERLITQRHF